MEDEKNKKDDNKFTKEEQEMKNEKVENYKQSKEEAKEEIGSQVKKEKNVIKIKLSTFIIILIVVIAIVAIIGYLIFKKSETNSELQTSDEKNYSQDVDFNISSYEGIWQYFENNTETPEKELIINKIDDSNVNFDLEMYRITSFENVSATLSKNIATFDCTNENGWNINGTITFENNTVTLDIAQSSTDIIPIGKTVFSTKSNVSILKNNLDSKTENVSNTISNTTSNNNISNNSSNENTNIKTNQNLSGYDNVDEYDTLDEILKKIMEKNTGKEVQYTYTFINNYYTLIVLIGDNEAEKEFLFYTYQKDGKAIYLGELGAGHSSLYEMNGKDYIMKVYGQMGDEEVYNISIQNNKIVETKVSNRTLSEGQDYVSGDIEIKFSEAKITDINEKILNIVKTDNTVYNNINSAYSSIIQQTKKLNANKGVQGAQTDIDKDGTNELILLVGDSEAEKEYVFYSFKQNKITYLGKLSGGHSGLYEMNGKNHIMKVFGQMGDEVVSNITIENNKIVQTEVSTRTISEGQDYTVGDKEIKFS